MTEVPENIQVVACMPWNAQQRMAVQVAEKSLELREEAFAIVERHVREMARRMRGYLREQNG